MNYLRYISIAVIINLTLLNMTTNFKVLDVDLDTKTQKQIYKVCEDNNVGFEFVMAVIEKESKFKADAVGDNGRSKGLMQVQPKWHRTRMKKLGATDLFDPEQNVKVGVDYLLELFEKYDDVYQVLMSYNMGESAAKRLWNKGIYKSEYSKEVVERAMEFEEELKWRD